MLSDLGRGWRKTLIGSESGGQMLAVLQIQWFSFKNSLRRRSDLVSLIVSILVALIWYGFWTAGAVGLCAFTLWMTPAKVARALPGILLLIFLYWQVSPVVTATMGLSIDLRKMALFPIEVRTLFLIECLLRLLTGLEMLLLLGGISIGIAVQSRSAVPIFLPALALFVLFNVLLDRKSTRLNSSHIQKSRMPSSA